MCLYVLYDARAMKDTDEASIFEVSEDLKELKESAKDYGGGVIYSYDDDQGKLINKKFIEYIEP